MYSKVHQKKHQKWSAVKPLMIEIDKRTISDDVINEKAYEEYWVKVKDSKILLYIKKNLLVSEDKILK